MPTEVAPVSKLSYMSPPSPVTVAESYYSSGETMSGYMYLIGPDKIQQGVQVIVYRTSLEHFAVVYPQKKVCRPLGVLNLRNTCVERLSSNEFGFVVRERGFDKSISLTFIVESPAEFDSWISAFTSRSSPSLHHSSLPIVEEEEV